MDTTKLEPESTSNLEDLDASTRQLVEKMMLEQRQKAAFETQQKNNPEMKRKLDILEQFKKQNPQLDVLLTLSLLKLIFFLLVF